MIRVALRFLLVALFSLTLLPAQSNGQYRDVGVKVRVPKGWLLSDTEGYVFVMKPESLDSVEVALRSHGSDSFTLVYNKIVQEGQQAGVIRGKLDAKSAGEFFGSEVVLTLSYPIASGHRRHIVFTKNGLTFEWRETLLDSAPKDATKPAVQAVAFNEPKTTERQDPARNYPSLGVSMKLPEQAVWLRGTAGKSIEIELVEGAYTTVFAAGRITLDENRFEQVAALLLAVKSKSTDAEGTARREVANVKGARDIAFDAATFSRKKAFRVSFVEERDEARYQVTRYYFPASSGFFVWIESCPSHRAAESEKLFESLRRSVRIK